MYTLLYVGNPQRTVILKEGSTLFGVKLPREYKIEYSIPLLTFFSSGKKVRRWMDSQINPHCLTLSSLDLHLTSKNPNVNLLEAWTNFVDTLQKDAVETSNTLYSDITVYDLKLVKTIQTIQEETPQDEDTEANDRNNKTDKKELHCETKALIKPKTHPKQKTTTTLSIDEQNINSLYKDFSTLYLKEKDNKILKGTLERFKNNKDIYTSLGLPYKFGALLYGEPGTGKSSAINAIASFLQKDIYYLDLTNIKTNDELKMLFHHVNKEKSKNGIIVIEDIDAMTDVVHIRTKETKNSDLTLECFLNLLQGSLTHDGTTFIITTNHIDKLDPALYRDGRFDIKIHLSACDNYQIQTIYKKFFKKEIPEDMLKRIPENKITPATFIQKLLPYILKPDTDDLEILQDILQ